MGFARKIKNMKDLTHYIIDYLPNVVIIPMGKGKQVGYEFGIQINGSGAKGLMLGYFYSKSWSSEGISDDNIFKYNLKTFDVNSTDFIFYATYIRDIKALEFAAMRCYKFLRKHNLCKRRNNNIKKKGSKLFRVLTSPV